MKARIIQGGWYWLGEMRHAGDIVEASEEWIANRERDGLAERIDAGDATPPPIDLPSEPVDAVPEAATDAPAETAALPSPRASAKKRG